MGRDVGDIGCLQGAGTERLLLAAMSLFAERGYDGVSALELAQAAGTSKGNLFHHFGSKQALYDQVLIAACASFRDELDRALAGSQTLQELLARLIRWHRSRLAERRKESQLVLREIMSPRPGSDHEAVRGAMMASFAHLLDWIRATLPEGSDPDEPRLILMAHLIMSSNIFDFLAQALFNTANGDLRLIRDEDYPERVAELLLTGLTAASISPSRSDPESLK